MAGICGPRNPVDMTAQLVNDLTLFGRSFEIMLEDLFGNIWSREGLSLRDRRLFTMGVIAALGEADVFGIQVETGLASGHLTEEQINEMKYNLFSN